MPSHRRTISWSAALQGLHADRDPVEVRRAAIAAQQAASLAKTLGKLQAREAVRTADAAPLVVAGRFDRAAIMNRAWARARSARAQGDARSWQVLVGIELRRAWAWARDARRAAAH